MGRRGGHARKVTVTATITAEKGPGGIRIQSSHVKTTIAGLHGIDRTALAELARETEEGCTISIAQRGTVVITSEANVV